MVNSLKTAVVHLRSENDKLSDEVQKKKCLIDNHALKVSKLRIANNNLKSTLNFEKSKTSKTIRMDQLTSVVDHNQVKIILGRASFGICKLMRLHVSGESVLVAAKEYESFVNREEIIHEMSMLIQISHICFPFVFGVALDVNLRLLLNGILWSC